MQTLKQLIIAYREMVGEPMMGWHHDSERGQQWRGEGCGMSCGGGYRLTWLAA